MPTYVVDDGCVFYTIKNAIEKKISPHEVSDYEEKISMLSNFIKNELKKETYISDDYINYKIHNDFIYNHLCSNKDAIFRDSFLQLFLALERLNKFNSESCINEDVYASDKFFASSFIQNKHSGLISNRDITSADWWNINYHFKTNNKDEVINVFRNKLLIDRTTYQLAFRYKHLFWPNCYFHVGSTNRFANLCVSETQLLPLLFKHLDFLNKDARQLFATYPEPSRFIAEAAVRGVDLSPESTNTKKNSSAMEERKIYINYKQVLCEWHTKLTATVGRVHYNLNLSEPSEISDTVGGKVIIGIYTDHLAT